MAALGVLPEIVEADEGKSQTSLPVGGGDQLDEALHDTTPPPISAEAESQRRLHTLSSADAFWVCGLIQETVERLQLLLQLQPTDPAGVQRLVSDEISALVEEQKHLGPVFDELQKTLKNEKLKAAKGKQPTSLTNAHRAIKDILAALNRSTCAMNLSLQDPDRFSNVLLAIHTETDNVFLLFRELMERLMIGVGEGEGGTFLWFVESVDAELARMAAEAAKEEPREVIISVDQWQAQIDMEKKLDQQETAEKKAALQAKQELLRNTKMGAVADGTLFEKTSTGILDAEHRLHDTTAAQNKQRIVELTNDIDRERRKCDALMQFYRRKIAHLMKQAQDWERKFNADTTDYSEKISKLKNDQGDASRTVKDHRRDKKLWKDERRAHEARVQSEENLRALQEWKQFKKLQACVLIQFYWRRYRIKRRRPRPPRRGGATGAAGRGGRGGAARGR
eukprot:gnl/Spiro4/6306_TR3241_c0_g1_i1.p1 gnl/Spiro4/6306_TR3241_c0_g1~~gnl/Spiro4/6306_TR3241_c0_g1_i1.p1  ORF type:complete len:451 (+),score=190.82 gnl/Spiro4/6306_TR3241_c0_g1_i1:67-1419(+)